MNQVGAEAAMEVESDTVMAVMTDAEKRREADVRSVPATTPANARYRIGQSLLTSLYKCEI